MNLLLRINVTLGLAFALGAVAAGYVCWGTLEKNAERQVITEAGLMMDSALAMRAYTSNEIDPLLSERMQHEFLPQSVPSYAATQSFLKLREARPQYSYKEATLNPTNLRDRAADWEADIIQRFRNDAQAREFVGRRDTPLGETLYLARPIHADAACLVCHSTPAAAPQTVLARYGSNNGFGWQANEVVGAQVVTVPFANAAANAESAFHAFMISLLIVFAATLIAVNIALYFLVVRPIRRMAGIADQLSLGDMSAPEFPVSGGKEIAALGRAFTRMRISLDKALKLLGT